VLEVKFAELDLTIVEKKRKILLTWLDDRK